MVQNSKKNLPKIIVLLLVIGFSLRVGFIVFSKSYVDPHDWEYGDIARNIVAGNGYARITSADGTLELTSSHAPLYPYLLSIFYHLGQKPWTYLTIQLVQVFLSLITVVILYKIALLLFTRTVALLTAFGVSVYPPFVYYCAKLVPTTIFLCLLSLTLLLVLEHRKNDVTYIISSGIALGLSLVCDPLAFALFPALIVWYFIQKKIPLGNILSLMFISLVLLVPWTVRNYSVHGQIVPVTTQFGINFWIGNNPNATGTDYYKVYSAEKGLFILMTETLPPNTQQQLKSMSEIERSQFFFNQGLKFIRYSPGKFFKLLFKKTYLYWWFAPSEIAASTDIAKYRGIYTIFYAPLLILGILGIALSLRQSYVKRASLIFLTIFFISSIYILTHVGLMRYRVPLEAYLIMFASFAVMTLIGNLPKSRALIS